jgi:hypothetical protein
MYRIYPFEEKNVGALSSVMDRKISVPLEDVQQKYSYSDRLKNIVWSLLSQVCILWKY